MVRWAAPSWVACPRRLARAPAWGLLPPGAAPAWGCSRQGPLPLGGGGAAPAWGRSCLGAAPSWGCSPRWGCSHPGLLPPGAAPARGRSLAWTRAPARRAGRVSIVVPPSVPSCIIIISQVGLEPIFPFISIADRNSINASYIALNLSAFEAICLSARL